MNYSPPNPTDPKAKTAMVLPHAGVLAISDETLDESRIVAFDSHDEQARAFNLLRPQILREAERGALKILGITSPTPAAGKTFLSLNLAAALSRIADRAVVLCDFDLRRGSIARAFQADVPIELSAHLRGEAAAWTDALYRINDTDCYILPCEPHTRGSGELLSSEQFKALIANLRALPEEVIVLCDLPPVFASDDALLTAQHLDAFLLVVEYGRNTSVQVKESLRLLDNVECFGTILNNYKGGLLDAYGYGYGDRYGLKNYGAEG